MIDKLLNSEGGLVRSLGRTIGVAPMEGCVEQQPEMTVQRMASHVARAIRIAQSPKLLRLLPETRLGSPIAFDCRIPFPVDLLVPLLLRRKGLPLRREVLLKLLRPLLRNASLDRVVPGAERREREEDNRKDGSDDPRHHTSGIPALSRDSPKIPHSTKASVTARMM